MKPIKENIEPQKKTEIQPDGSAFVEIVDGKLFDVKLQYPLMDFQNSVDRCFVRKEVFAKLVEAQKLLPNGIRLRIWDTWRPLALQKELYRFYSQKIINDFHLACLPQQEQQKFIANFVSPPQTDEMCPPVHTTGGAVDVTLIDRDGNELPMGTAFDAFTPKTHTTYYENNPEDLEIQKNRRLLYNCMTEVGFTNLPSEWWHYDYGDRFWAFYNDCPAIYEGIFTPEGIKLEK